MSRNCLRTAGFTRAMRLTPRTLASSALLVACALSLTALGLPAAWATGDGPAAKAAPAANVTAPMSVEWKYTGTAFPGNEASPVVSADSVFFASGGRIYCVSLSTGGLKWRYPYESFMPASVTNTPALVGDTLVVPTGDGLYCMNAADGKMKFPVFRLTKGGVATTPVAVGDNVYFGSAEGRIYGINLQTGDPVGGNYKNGLNAGDLAGDITAQDGTLYFVTSNSILHAVDAAAGVQRWSQPYNGISGRVTPVVDGETLLVSSGQLLTAYRISNGIQRWVLPTHNDITAPPAVDADGNIFLVTSDRGIYALDPLKKPIWNKDHKSDFKAPQTDYEVDTQPIIAGDLLIVGTSAGAVYAFDKTTGELKWNYAIQPTSSDPNRVPINNKVTARPVVVGDSLFVLTDDGALTMFRHDAPDALPPMVDHLEPTQGDYLNGRPPFEISAHIADDGSGLKADTITLKVDDQIIRRGLNEEEVATKPGFIFLADEGILRYTILENEAGQSHGLLDGHHTVTITASDWKGNTATKSWSFYTDDALKVRAKRNGTNSNIGRGRNGAASGSSFGSGGGPGGGGKGN